VATPLGGAARVWPAPPGGVGRWLLPSLSASGYFCLLMKYEYLGIFIGIADLQKYGVLTVVFPAQS
jgi:hypothetical protein